MKRLTLLFIVLLGFSSVAATCQAAPSPPPEPVGERLGWNAKGMGDRADVDRELEQVAASGGKWLRGDFNWPTLEMHGKGQYNWTPGDYMVEKANSLGLRIMGLVTYAPRWVSTYPQPNVRDFRDFIDALVRRYAPMGVHHWEIWNEANLKGPWPGAPNPAFYTELLKAAYTAIHNVDPSATVVSSGLSPAPDQPAWGLRPATFLQRMYDNGAKGYFDAVGLHINLGGRAPEPEIKQTWNLAYSARTEMYPLMQRMGDGEKKIWVTEMGYSSTNADPSHGVTEEQQGPYLRDLLKQWLKHSFVGPTFIYTLRDPGTDRTNWFDMMGLIRRDYSPKPAWGTVTDYILNGE